MATNRERFAVAKENAQKAVDEGNAADAQKFLEEAQGIKALIEAEETIKGLDIPQTPPIRPPMPGTGTGATPEQPAQDQESGPVTDPFVKSFYVNKFKEPATVVETVLKDLHGPDFMGAYWRNRNAFLKYVRYGFDGASWDRDEMNALKEIILTPLAVETALVRGFDSVAALKATMIESQETVGGLAYA